MATPCFETDGRLWRRAALDDATLQTLDVACDTGASPGRRLLLDPPPALTALARELLPGAMPVRVVAFNKSAAENWTLPWHQDRVALSARSEARGFDNWSNKAGTWHAEPPVAMLDRMIFARIHLDPADETNGCLQFALGTHARGKIAAADAETIATAAPLENCIAQRGDVLFAKVLILHRSSPSRVSAGRRAIRIDYCADALPPPLQWAA